MTDPSTTAQNLKDKYPHAVVTEQQTADGIPTLWIVPEQIHEVLRYLKDESTPRFKMLYDLTAIDERSRSQRKGQPAGSFTVVYHLLSHDANEDIRLKVALEHEYPSLISITDIWASANWYEREVWDMFGIRFDGHPNLRRILMPPGWVGHPLRKEHPARATEMEPYQLPEEKEDAEQELLRFHPEEWGMKRHGPDSDFLFLNFGPHHPGTHGVVRIILQLDSEEIVDSVVDIGYHHRGAEKMGERQSWHTYIPYTDRVDYLAGVQNNFPYCLTVEKLARIDLPGRAKVIRIMMAELFRISSHLVWYGTFAQDIGALSPVFFTFTDREYLLSIVEAVCGARLHPNWFRIGGVAQDLPDGWDTMVRDFIKYLPPRLKEYDSLIMQNKIIKARTKGIGCMTADQAIEWGVTGPNLRASGVEWDVRKKRPYSGYEHFDFEVPTAPNGDCYDRAVVHVEEMRQSLRIIEQCLNNMPEGPYKADHPATTPPIKKHTMHDIETLIAHFLNVSWGPVIPPGEAGVGIEAPKGYNTYYLISDGNTMSYRTRIRTPSFAHMQTLPMISRGHMVPDLITMLAAMDFVLADVDR